MILIHSDGCPVIDDGHNQDLLNLDGSNPEHGRGRVPRNYDATPFGSLPFAKPVGAKPISRSEWKERIQALISKKAVVSEMARRAGVQTKNQAQTNFCWAFALLLLILCSGCLRPDPVPVDPKPPVPVVDPVVTTGAMRVLILHENDDRAKYSWDTIETLSSPKLIEWLNTHKAEWRIWDQNIDTQYAEPFWQKAVDLPHGDLPWIWISPADGSKGVNGPLPKTLAETLELLGRYAK